MQICSKWHENSSSSWEHHPRFTIPLFLGKVLLRSIVCTNMQRKPLLRVYMCSNLVIPRWFNECPNHRISKTTNVRRHQSLKFLFLLSGSESICTSRSRAACCCCTRTCRAFTSKCPKRSSTGLGKGWIPRGHQTAKILHQQVRLGHSRLLGLL